MAQTSTSVFDTLLNPAEKIIWSGKPRQGFVLRRSDVFFIPFSILWTVLAVWWEIDVVLSDVPFQEKIWGIVMLSMAAYILLLRFLVDALYRFLTYYALTNQRILIHTGFLKTTMTSLSLATQKDIHLDLRENGTGDIVFGPLDPKSWMHTGGGWIKMGRQAGIPVFELLDDAKRIHKQILAQQKKVK